MPADLNYDLDVVPKGLDELKAGLNCNNLGMSILNWYVTHIDLFHPSQTGLFNWIIQQSLVENDEGLFLPQVVSCCVHEMPKQ